MFLNALTAYIRSTPYPANHANVLHQFVVDSGKVILKRYSSDTHTHFETPNTAVPAVMGVDVVLVVYQADTFTVINVNSGKVLAGLDLDNEYIKFLPEHCKPGKISFGY